MEIEPNYSEGQIGVIHGNLGSGKSDIALLIAQCDQIAFFQRYKKRIILLTNIEGPTTKFIKRFKTDLELLTLFTQHHGPKMVIFDEGGVFASSKRIMANQAVFTEHLVVLIRKFRCSIIFIAQLDSLTLPTVRNLASWSIEKLNKKEALFEIDGNLGKPFDIPRTSIPFDSHAVAYFEFTLDIDSVFAEIANLPEKQMLARLKKIIQNPIDFQLFD